MFKDEYVIEVTAPSVPSTFNFTFNTNRIVNVSDIATKQLRLSGYVALYINPIINSFQVYNQAAITSELISDVLECAETLKVCRRYIPPHWQRSEWIETTIKAMTVDDVAVKPFELLIDRINALPIRTVVCAANRVWDDRLPEGVLIIPANRHHSPTMNAIYGVLELRDKKSRTARDEQGFIDQWGQFLSREEALKVVLSSGQPFNVERNGDGSPPARLYSEGLY